ncbi:conserved hypothetical protein [Xenorhabdus nematophila F1]|uniref:Uncharacterized protein n=1 Tax=Xenorhabdus nematophila (strain ATCC 19061 / DSM 3370 / CCUG 14189 / LMG 1036 / NCIMB 9965 / AN6) TaxID=406817 RepID=D3VFW3_XENNA|nr:hypothetical protein XNC1_4607 [Xenorhabdus nematophila ATCC 19061]CCW32786.1 conserved hypothetical protein [Xenorhabdus nematophila F1]CEE92025.1 hypothetical protein XNA1_2610019 [Xenorhabdus nematophila str. Anatoliense]CEK25436.1 hypothetical protein XNC2_4449 [Xenorhabdus nematophila AN6/1]
MAGKDVGPTLFYFHLFSVVHVNVLHPHDVLKPHLRLKGACYQA